MDAADVQAVAEWQKDHGSEFEPKLKIDGKAGPRTLPRMFGSGLAPSKNIAEYAGEMKEIINKWDKLKTPEARRAALEKEINAHLTSVGVPAVELKGDPKGTGNHFDNEPWVILIKPIAFDDMPSDAEERDLRATRITATLYHEARHAEQDFRIAAMLAGRKQSADRIFAQTKTKPEIIQEAMKKENQLKPGTMEAVIAEGWFDSIYGVDSAERTRILREKDEAMAAANAAADAFNANRTPENKRKLAAAVKRQDRALAAYENLPEENDAHRIGNEVVARFQALLKQPATSP
jgi:hypothetical protein